MLVRKLAIPSSSHGVLRAGASCGILPRRAALVGNARVVLLGGLRGGLDGAVCLISPFRRAVSSKPGSIRRNLRSDAGGGPAECATAFRASRGGSFGSC